MREGCLFWLCLSASGLALAEPPTKQPTALHYRFEDELVKGEDPLPGHDLVVARRPGRRASLIAVKTSLVAELFKTAEDL